MTKPKSDTKAVSLSTTDCKIGVGYFAEAVKRRWSYNQKNAYEQSPSANDYDLSSNMVEIIRVCIDRAKKWIEGGELLTQDYLIPPPEYDPGYELLLTRGDLFKNSSLKKEV